MAIYHLRMTSIAKAAGHSAGEKAKYIARLGQYPRVRGGRQRDPVLHVESLHMPGWARDAAGEEAERRSAAALAYWQASDVGSRANGRVVEYEFALPREMTLEQQIELAREFAREVTQVEGGVLPATFAIHAGGGINVHAHLEVSEAINDGIERGPETWFKRAANPGKPPQSGGCRKTRELQRPERLVHLRERLAVLTNAALARYGHAARVDHRSYADRGLDIVPQEHVGRGPQAEAARARNARRRSVNDRARELQAELEQITQTHAATAALTEAPDDRHRPDQHRPGAAGLPRRPSDLTLREVV